MGNAPIDMNVIKLLEEIAADEETLDKQLNIYDVCRTNTGLRKNYKIVLLKIYDQLLIPAKVLPKYSGAASIVIQLE